jgi:hypothetical protein
MTLFGWEDPQKRWSVAGKPSNQCKLIEIVYRALARFDHPLLTARNEALRNPQGKVDYVNEVDVYYPMNRPGR